MKWLVLAGVAWCGALLMCWACVAVGAEADRRSRDGQRFSSDLRSIYTNTLPRRTGWELGDPDELAADHAQAIAEAQSTKGWPL